MLSDCAFDWSKCVVDYMVSYVRMRLCQLRKI